jgi:hypothetical protein
MTFDFWQAHISADAIEPHFSFMSSLEQKTQQSTFSERGG